MAAWRAFVQELPSRGWWENDGIESWEGPVLIEELEPVEGPPPSRDTWSLSCGCRGGVTRRPTTKSSSSAQGLRGAGRHRPPFPADPAGGQNAPTAVGVLNQEPRRNPDDGLGFQ